MELFDAFQAVTIGGQFGEILSNGFIPHITLLIANQFACIQINIVDISMPTNLRAFVVLLSIILAFSRSEYKVTDYTCLSTACYFNLTYTGTNDYYVNPKNAIVKNLKATFRMLTFYDFTFKIADADKQRFEVPQGDGFPEDYFEGSSFPIEASRYGFSYTLNPFDFRISRKINNSTIFSTYDVDIIYSNYYIQIGSQVQNDYLYGLGERFSSHFRVQDGKWTIFNRDHPFEIDIGDGHQTYGYYPYYLNREKAGFFHLTYFRNSNAMDVIKQKNGGKTFLTFKTIGGIIDFRFFLADASDPTSALARISSQVYAGNSNVPPFWSLGFHQCRWGYEDIDQLLDVLSNYQKNGIPLDTIWSDIDYMLDFQNFSIDEERFPLDQIRKIQEKYKYIPIIDAGIKIDGIAYNQGLKRNVFVNDANGVPFIGAVWPGDTTFVDFFHPNASKYWEDMLDILYQKVKFDGVWLDMNEVSNFCNGPCSVPTTPTVFDYTNDLPYHPGSSKIQDSTIPLNCTHYKGIKEADVHVFHAFLQTKATNSFLQNKRKRPFIVSRSSTIGSSKYGNHWTGDNAATWAFLQTSIPNIFNSHVNGFKMVGEDICGFAGDTTVQLCARWYQLGTLYPFSRSHNAYGSIPQEPYALGQVVLQSATKAIKLRYSLLKHMYTYMLTQEKPYVWSPLFFMFPNDEKTYLNQIADTAFILASNILVAPILEQGKTSRSVYFPNNNWVDLYSGKNYAANESAVVNCGLVDNIPLFIAEGQSVLLQDVANVRNTNQLDNRFSLYSAFAQNSPQSFISKASILSLNDYNDEQKIKICEKNYKCFYQVSLVINTQSDQTTLTVKTSYNGPAGLDEQVIIQNLNLYYNYNVLRVKPAKSIVLSKGSQQTIVLNGAQNLSSQ